MSLHPILYILGWIMSGFGLVMLSPALVANWYGDTDTHAFLYAAGGGFCMGVLLVLMFRGEEKNLSHRDGFLLTLLTWVSLSFIGALPIYFAGVVPTFADAFFEAVSGLTTTGATVLTGLDDMGHGILLWRAMLQWLGGMGIIVLAIAVMPFLGVGGLQLYRSEMPGVVTDKLQPRLKETAKALWGVYVLVTILCALCYSLAGMTTFDAVAHALTTTAIGGFSTHDASFAYFNAPLVELVAIIFMLVGAMNYSLHYLALSGRGVKAYLNDPECRFFFMIVSVAMVLVIFTLAVAGWRGGDHNMVRDAVFNIVSVFTTTGYTNADYSAWPVLTHLLILMLMFIGGCTGSTAGGMKVLRSMIIFKQGGRELARLIHPRGVVHVKLGSRMVPDHVIQAVWSFAGLYVLIFLLVAMGVSMFGVGQITSFSAAAATLTGLGPGLGEVGPAGTYAGLPQGAKMLLCASMLLGRLEIFTILVIFSPQFWRK